MKVSPLTPPRTFPVGETGAIVISHTADIRLEPDEQITLRTQSGTEFDVVRKDFGYYATPSLNGRLVGHNLRAALVRGRKSKRAFILLCETGHEQAFQAYCDAEDMRIVCWVSDDADLDRLEAAFPDTQTTR